MCQPLPLFTNKFSIFSLNFCLQHPQQIHHHSQCFITVQTTSQESSNIVLTLFNKAEGEVQKALNYLIKHCNI